MLLWFSVPTLFIAAIVGVISMDVLFRCLGVRLHISPSLGKFSRRKGRDDTDMVWPPGNCDRFDSTRTWLGRKDQTERGDRKAEG